MGKLRDRLVARARREGECWIWTGQLDSDGYGRYGNRRDLAHRVVYSEFVGDPTGMSVLHRCDNPACVNPEHLFLGSQRDNMADMYAKKRENLSGLQRGQRPEILKRIAENAERNGGRFAKKDAAIDAAKGE